MPSKHAHLPTSLRRGRKRFRLLMFVVNAVKIDSFVLIHVPN